MDILNREAHNIYTEGSDKSDNMPKVKIQSTDFMNTLANFKIANLDYISSYRIVSVVVDT